MHSYLNAYFKQGDPVEEKKKKQWLSSFILA